MKKIICALAAFTVLSFATCSRDDNNGGEVIENGKPTMKPVRRIKQIMERNYIDKHNETTGVYDFVYTSNGELLSYSYNAKETGRNNVDFIQKKEVYYEKINNSIIENSTFYQKSGDWVDRNEKVKITHILNDKGYIIKSVTDNNADRTYEYNEQNRLSSAEAFDGGKLNDVDEFSLELNYNNNNCIDRYNYC